MSLLLNHTCAVTICSFHRFSRSKLRKLCRTYNIKTLDELLQISPSAFVTYKGIGTTTAYNVREVIESLGIVWSDANTSF